MPLEVHLESNEDSQGRQLRINKKLSKVISSVPRSRFIKPRPNVLGVKRNDAISSTARKSNNTSQHEEDTNEKKDSIPKIEETSVKKEEEEAIKREVPVSNEKITFQKEEKTDKTYVEIIFEKEKKADETPRNVDGIPIKTEESEQINDVPFNIEEIIDKEPTVNAAVSSPISNETIQEEPVSNVAVSSQNFSESFQDTDRNTEIENPVSTPTPEQSKSCEVAPVSTSSSDKSSKYPHLTSILSKKRAEPKKEVQQKRRKKFKKGDVIPERSKMTMADLIYWNPGIKEEPKNTVNKSTVEEQSETLPTVEEEEVDRGEDAGEEDVTESVPKLVISEDGQINIDQSSLIISRNIPQPVVTEIVRKDDTTYSSFRKRPLTKHWNIIDTALFYKALTLVGTDFGLMETFFPHRTRRELKQKFKREEKFHQRFVNKAIYESQLTHNVDEIHELVDYLNKKTNDRKLEARNRVRTIKEKKITSKKQKQSKKKKSVDDELSDYSPTEKLTNETISKRDVSNKRKRKSKKLPENFIDIDNPMELNIEETNDNVNETQNNATSSAVEQPCESEETVAKQSLIKALNKRKKRIKNVTKNQQKKRRRIKNMYIDSAESDNASSQEIITDVTDAAIIETVTENQQIRTLSTDSSEIDSTSCQEITEVNDSAVVQSLTQKLQKRRKRIKTLSTDSSGPDNVQEITVDITNIVSPLSVPDDNAQSFSMTIENAQSDCEIVECIETISSAGDSSLLNDVVAFEVVSSEAPVSKRKRPTHTPKAPENSTVSCLSPANYTPT